jgi:hypothetical protein
VSRYTRVATIVLVLVSGLGLGACSRSDNGASTATVAGFCRVVKQEGARLANLSGSRELVAKAATEIQKLVHASPPEIRDDVQLVADSYEKVANGDFAALASRAVKLQAAGEHLAKYAQDNCHIDIRGG